MWLISKWKEKPPVASLSITQIIRWSSDSSILDLDILCYWQHFDWSLEPTKTTHPYSYTCLISDLRLGMVINWMVNNLELQSPFLYLFGSSELGKFRIPNETNFTMYSIFAFPHFFFFLVLGSQELGWNFNSNLGPTCRFQELANCSQNLLIWVGNEGFYE